jgi:hypothetical protein
VVKAHDPSASVVLHPVPRVPIWAVHSDCKALISVAGRFMYSEHSWTLEVPKSWV